MGTATGMIYGILAELFPVATRGLGLPFGALVWLSIDEIALWRLRLAKIPTSYPGSRHVLRWLHTWCTAPRRKSFAAASDDFSVDA